MPNPTSVQYIPVRSATRGDSFSYGIEVAYRGRVIDTFWYETNEKRVFAMGQLITVGPEVYALLTHVASKCWPHRSAHPCKHEEHWPSDDPDKIKIVWSVEDVFEVCPRLTREQAREVLERVKSKHDAEYGVNWDVLRGWANDMFPEGEGQDDT